MSHRRAQHPEVSLSAAPALTSQDAARCQSLHPAVHDSTGVWHLLEREHSEDQGCRLQALRHTRGIACLHPAGSDTAATDLQQQPDRTSAVTCSSRPSAARCRCASSVMPGARSTPTMRLPGRALPSSTSSSPGPEPGTKAGPAGRRSAGGSAASSWCVQCRNLGTSSCTPHASASACATTIATARSLPGRSSEPRCSMTGPGARCDLTAAW